VGARPWLASPINSALLIAFTPGSLSLGGIGFRVLTKVGIIVSMIQWGNKFRDSSFLEVRDWQEEELGSK
jgi:hypothetical protein